MRIILSQNEVGWFALCFNMPGMAKDESREIQLLFTPQTPLETVLDDLRKSFPQARIYHRSGTYGAAYQL